MPQQRPACRDGGTAVPPDSRNRSWRPEAGNSLRAQPWATLRLRSLRLRSGQARQAFRPAAGARLGGPALAGKTGPNSWDGTCGLKPAPGHGNSKYSAAVLSLVCSCRVARSSRFFDAGSQTQTPRPEGLSQRFRALQVGGGSEFAAEFEFACQQRSLPLFVLPPRSPKLNGHVERAQRTHTEESISYSTGNPNERRASVTIMWTTR